MLGSTQFAFETPNVIDEGDAPPPPPMRTSFTSPQSQQQSPSSQANLNGGVALDEDDSDYHEARESAARLLNDISDLELSQFNKPKLPRSQRLPFRDFPQQQARNNIHTTAATANTSTTKPYDPYDEEDNDHIHHSLPNSAEDARLHAHMLLQHQRMSKPASPLPPHSFGRTLQLSAPSSRSPHRRRPTKNQRGNSSSSASNKAQEAYWATRDFVESFLLRYGPMRIACALVVLIAVVLVCTITLAERNGSGGNSNSNSGSGSKHVKADPVRFESVLDVLVQRGVSSRDDLTKDSTPQHAALQWLTTTDKLQYDANNPRLVQRYILVVFYFATGGTFSRETSTWATPLQFVTDVDECAWNEVTATPQFITQKMVVGVSCNEQLEVTALFVPNHGVTGQLPSELAKLPSLQLLGLPDNVGLTGSLPTSFSSNYQDLLYFNVNNCSLSGTIPAFIGDWADLEVLGLGHNQLTGTLPASLGTASRIKTLSLSNNRLSGSLDVIAHLSKLQYLYVGRNNFTGHIEDRFFFQLGDLREFDVSQNRLSGDLPLNLILSERNLHILDVSFNNFTGTFPEITDYNFAMHFISMRNNSFSGSIPTSIKKLGKIQHFDMSNNQFSGQIANDGIGGCATLTYLALSGNPLDVGGDLLPPLNGLVNLRELSLSGLGLTGSIPSWLRFLEKLQMVDLSYNSLISTIPENIWTLPNLHALLLNNNALTGPLPLSGGNQFSVLAVHHNNIVDSAFDVAVCDSNSTTATTNVVVSADCDAGCSKGCCTKCCHDDGDFTCESDKMAHYKSGLNYTEAALSFDPDILDEAGVFLSSLDLDDTTDP